MTTADLVRAIDLALGGKWDEAHGIVQQDEADRTAAWIHAVLHTIEGDSSNARSWYARAGKLDRADCDPTAELTVLRATLAK